jgi:hypothetical protein
LILCGAFKNSFVAGTHNQDSCLLLTEKDGAIEITPTDETSLFSQLLEHER